MRSLLPLTSAAILCIGFVRGLVCADDAPAKPDPFEALLKEFGQPSKGLSGAELARSLLLVEGVAARVNSLIEDLSGEDFSKREKAVGELIAIPAPIDGALWKAREGADPGLGLMLDRALETRQNLRALERSGYVFQAIAENATKGLAVAVARTVSAFEWERDLEVVRAGISAVIATVEPGDKIGLEKVIAEAADAPSLAAVAGLTALAVRAGEEIPDLQGKGGELGVAYALAALGDARAAGHLVGLLESESVLVRGEAARLLDACAGQKEHFAGAFDPLPRRLDQIKWWKNWIAESGGKPALAAAVPDGGWQGITVACVSGQGGSRVVALGMAGTEGRVLTSGVGGISGVPKAASLGSDGSAVIMTSAGADSSSLHLFDPGGRWLWSAEGIAGAGGFAVLGGGNYLLADGKKPVLNEIDWLGVKGEERKICGVASGLQMLAGGRMLAVIPEQKAIVELDESGAEMWRMENLEGVRFARRLANGHHLVIDSRGLTEFDWRGEAEWKVEPVREGAWGEISSAARRPGGNTYLGTDQGLLEITPGLRVLKQVVGGQINSLEAY